jgi:PhzF family phenazine biosynthesis protein
MRAYLVDAFTERRFEGNPAGVVLDAEGLSREDKQRIASELHASETAFVSPSGVADYKVEFFTPTTEVDFCGHATVATFFALASTGRIAPDARLTQETRAGVLPIAVARRNDRLFVMMTQRAPKFAAPRAQPAELAQALKIREADLDDLYPLQRANTGNWHLIAAVKSRECLDAIQYDAAALSWILRDNESVTAHLFCAGGPRLYHARNFCPTVGVPEDPATGSAAGAFGAYLAHRGFLDEGTEEFQILQGEAMGRPSRITVRIRSRDRQVKEVQVSGTAVISFVLSEA